MLKIYLFRWVIFEKLPMFTYFEENVYDNLSEMGHKNPSEYAPRPNMRPVRICTPQNLPLKNMHQWAHFPQFTVCLHSCESVLFNN